MIYLHRKERASYIPAGAPTSPTGEIKDGGCLALNIIGYEFVGKTL